MAEGKFILNNGVFLLLTVDVKESRSQLKLLVLIATCIGNIPLDNLTNTKAKAVKITAPFVADTVKNLINNSYPLLRKNLNLAKK
jgi:hypothetical protein